MNIITNKILTTTPTKDLLSINKSQFFKLNILNKEKNKIIKKCTICAKEKSLKDFSISKNAKDKLQSSCKDCQNNYYKTLNGCFKRLISAGKHHSKERKNKGRIDAGIFDTTLSYLEDLWKKQNGRCYYSNIPMNYDKRNWKVSLERLDTNKGYTNDNIALCCQEFNCYSQWSYQKIKEMINIINEDIICHLVSFDLVKKESQTRKKIIKTIIKDIEHYNCNRCNKVKPIYMFNKKISTGCKECISIKNKKEKDNPRLFLKKLVGIAKSSTKHRIKINNIKRDNTFNIDFDYLVELYNKQRGLCAYSKLPLKFGSYLEKNWTCSLERINVKKGYIKGNVCLICLEFNTGDKTIIYTNEEEGSCGWSKEKFKMFLNNITTTQKL